jgi:competence protein ComEA
MEQRYEGIRKGLLLLIPVVLGIFLCRTAGMDKTGEAADSAGDVFVQIDGDVKYPGVYFIKDLNEIRRLIEQEGGINPESLANAGLAAIPISSGSKITIQRDNNSIKLTHAEISPFHRITLGMPVSINLESEEGLTSVPGIGPLLAQSIVKARAERGGFKSLEELKSVRGIGDKTYKKIIAYLAL